MTTPSIKALRGGHAAPRTADGQHRLSAEIAWLVEGRDDHLLEIEAVLSSMICERVGQALLLRFGNAVGAFDGGPLGRLIVHSDKWEGSHFDAMLAEITARMAVLPFAAGTGAHLGHERSITTEQQVLYHAFVYLRQVCCASAPTEERLVPALRLILAQPHRRFERVTCWTPLHAVQRVEPRGLLGLVTPRARLVRAPRMKASPLAQALRGHLPEQVEETRTQSTVDVAENRFVKAFLRHAQGIVDRMRAVAISIGDGHFSRRISTDCDMIARELAPVCRHALWDEVSEMRRVPAESPVLQRRRGYREVFRHFVRLRLTARLPLRPEVTMRLLEIKDIAELYEIWSFFEVERQVSTALGRPPLEVQAAEVGALGAHLAWGMRVAWDHGVELFYNLSYSRSRGGRRSYSLPLRPDVVLRIAHGPAAGDHLFDAKFKVRRLEDAVQSTDDVDDVEQSAERRGVFKHADLYKMHTYRDAITSARSVWILYPGSEFRFFDEERGRVDLAENVLASASGVGAIGLTPGAIGLGISAVIGRLLSSMVAGKSP